MLQLLDEGLKGCEVLLSIAIFCLEIVQNIFILPFIITKPVPSNRNGKSRNLYKIEHKRRAICSVHAATTASMHSCLSSPRCRIEDSHALGKTTMAPVMSWRYF
jgi:hypothetical protein